MKTVNEIEAQLDENIPRDVVSQRQAGGGRSLSYLETWYVIDRLNKVFGNLGWDSETVEMRQVSDAPARYVAKVRLKVSSPVLSTEGSLQGFKETIKEGTGWGSDKPRKDGSVESPHEMAVKEAESDALKRAAMKLGISMGLGLYDKSGSYVDDVPEEAKPSTPTPVPTPQMMDRKKINNFLMSYRKILLETGKKTDQTLKEDLMKMFGAASTAELNDDQAGQFMQFLKQATN